MLNNCKVELEDVSGDERAGRNSCPHPRRASAPGHLTHVA